MRVVSSRLGDLLTELMPSEVLVTWIRPNNILSETSSAERYFLLGTTSLVFVTWYQFFATSTDTRKNVLSPFTGGSR